MKRFFFTIITVITLSSAKSQIHEVGIIAGGSNIIGDVGNETYVNPNKAAFGLLYKWNANSRYSWRFSYMHSDITSSDIKSNDKRRQIRGLSFENNVNEISAGFEFNFVDFNLHNLEPKITPYIATGASYVHYNSLFFDGNSKMSIESDSRGTFAIPMIIGVKHNISPHFILAAEVGARYTLADDIDGSNPQNENLKNFRFGNVNSNDWFMFSGLTLTYTFGNKPCYCAD